MLKRSHQLFTLPIHLLLLAALCLCAPNARHISVHNYTSLSFHGLVITNYNQCDDDFSNYLAFEVRDVDVHSRINKKVIPGNETIQIAPSALKPLPERNVNFTCGYLKSFYGSRCHSCKQLRAPPISLA